MFFYTIGLVLVSLSVGWLGMAGMAYAVAATLLGLGFLAVAAAGLRRAADSRWARQAFAFSLIYLPALIGVLVLDARW